MNTSFNLQYLPQGERYLCFPVALEHFCKQLVFSFGVFAFSKLNIIVSSCISSINSSTSLSFHAIPRDFPGDFCSVFSFPQSAMLSESLVDLHMLSQIGADQMREGSSEKSWFGTANRLHCTRYLSWARFSGSRTNSIRARTTSRHGPSMRESLVQHGWGKVVYTTKSIRAAPFFSVRVLFSSEPCQNFSAV